MSGLFTLAGLLAALFVFLAGLNLGLGLGNLETLTTRQTQGCFVLTLFFLAIAALIIAPFVRP